MNVLSLFDGMSCGQIALERAGIEVKNYFASEIDKSAIQVAKHNYPSTVHVGDITKIKYQDGKLFDCNGVIVFEGGIDLVIGGSPCQSISNLGDRTGLDGKSGLFFEFLRILKEVNPKYFLLENVAGNKKSIATISELMNVNPVEFNSNLVSAQNRKRLYWTNIDFTLPDDLEIKLPDILDSFYNQELILRGKGLNKVSKARSRVVSRDDLKFPCLLATQYKKATDCVIIRDGEIYRYPTRPEMERMQTVPVGYTATVSYNEAAKMLGNGWTIDAVTHIFKHIKG